MKKKHRSAFFVVVNVLVTLVSGAVVTVENVTEQDLNTTVTPSTVGESSTGGISSTTVTVSPSIEKEMTPKMEPDRAANDTVSDPFQVSTSLSNLFEFGVNRTPFDNNNTSSSFNISEYNGPVRKCTQKDSAGLNKCLQQVLKDLKPRLAEGIPEINLPPMEPLKLSNVAFQQGSGPVKITSEFSNVEVSGLANFSQSNFWVDVPKRTLDFDIIFPQLSILGNYDLSGNLFVIPIGGSGNFYLNLGFTRAKGSSKLTIFRNTTTAQVVVKKTDVNLEIGSIKVALTNLFNGDPLLGTVINNFLNENSQEVFEEVKPQIGAQVGELLSLLANRALAALSTNQFDDVPFSPEDDGEEQL